jgi:hypothetical protein
VRYGGPVERCFTVAFGPSRSKRFGKAVAEARRGANECLEVEPGRYEARFLVGTDPAAYAALAAFLARVRHWRATEVSEGDEPVSAYHAKEMGWCASAQLGSFGACRFRFFYGVFPRCSLCPLFDAERAIRDVLGENGPPPGPVIEITLGPTLRALLRGEVPAALVEESEPSCELPDFPPEGWGSVGATSGRVEALRSGLSRRMRARRPTMCFQPLAAQASRSRRRARSVPTE